MKKIVYQTKKAKVIQTAQDTYELHTMSIRNDDGISAAGWNLYCTYGNWYCRDWMGRTLEYNSEHNPRGDAILEATRY